MPQKQKAMEQNYTEVIMILVKPDLINISVSESGLNAYTVLFTLFYGSICIIYTVLFTLFYGSICYSVLFTLPYLQIKP